jgi:hypothetical protein
VTSLKGIRRFTPQDRFFRLAEYLTIYLDMEIYAVAASQSLTIRPPGNHFATLISNQFPVEIRHSVFGPFWASFQPTKLLHYEFEFVQTRERTSQKLISSNAWGDVAKLFWNTALVFFYEQHRPWIQTQYGRTSKDIDKWPAILRFAWALRNAAAHHGGVLNITDPRVPPVTWHHLKYDHTNVGLRVFGDVMSIADMLIFLVEMSDELDRLGCPHP